MGSAGGSNTNCVKKHKAKLKPHETGKDLNDGGENRTLTPSKPRMQKIEHDSRGSAIRWERFLPLRTLQVLLVEHDDSTRQVVGALLRNCSYEVIAASNGLQAWKILEDQLNQVDLVLTEVNLPYLSGIGLLSKIMSHTTCKYIPMIMMSSHDSMGLVLKCLSKGAVDFLVKPIRKNELKNLWQHVWRRCRSSSGSGSESGVRTLKSPRNIAESDNGARDSDEDDNGSTGVEDRDGLDKGSVTQSSWTNRSIEVDSQSSWDHGPESCYGTFAHVLHPSREISGSELHVASKIEQDVDKDPRFIPCSAVSNLPNEVREEGKEHPSKRSQELPWIDNACHKMQPEAADLIGSIARRSNGRTKMGPTENTDQPAKVLEKQHSPVHGAGDLSSLDLSLRRLRSGEDGVPEHCDEQNVLKQSDQSAFSRYSTATCSPQGAIGCGAVCPVPVDNVTISSCQAPREEGSNGSNSNECASKNGFMRPAALPSTSICTVQRKSAFVPIQHSRTTQTAKEADGYARDETMAQPKGPHQIQHHHYHYHHHGYHVHSVQHALPVPQKHDQVWWNNMIATGGRCGSSSVFDGQMERNGNCSQNASAACSCHGSNGHNGSSTGMNYGGMNMESDNGAGGTVGISGNMGPHNRSARRDAALTKFRQKRKERCYEKKVRYQSRKKLAEERPRIRGQFVRQSRNGNGCGNGHGQS